MMKYSISIKWSDEDNGFIAFTPELSGLSAFGETSTEAVAELQVATEAFLESLKDADEELPAPNKLISYSGQTRLRMPRSLHADLAAEAENEGVSLNTYTVSLLAERHCEKETVKLLKQVICNLEIQKYATNVKGLEGTETKVFGFGKTQPGIKALPLGKTRPKTAVTFDFDTYYNKKL